MVIFFHNALVLQAAQNLIVLAREPSGAEKIFKSGGVANLIKMLDTEKDTELQLTAVRVLACLCKDSKDRVGCALDTANQNAFPDFLSSFVRLKTLNIDTLVLYTCI